MAWWLLGHSYSLPGKSKWVVVLTETEHKHTHLWSGALQAVGTETPGFPWLYNESEASLGYMRYRLKQTNNS